MTHRSYGTDGYVADEEHLVFTGRGYTGGGPLVLMCSFGVDPSWFTDTPSRRTDMDLLAELGFVVMAADLGGVTWANDTFLARADSAIAWAETEWDADITYVSLLADSMGGACALNWAWRNTGQLAGLSLRVPAVNVNNLYIRSHTAAIDAAYGGDWGGNRATHDPSDNTGLISAFRDKVLVWYATDDPTVDYEDDIAPFIAATGCQSRSMGAVGHDPYAIDDDVQAAHLLEQLRLLT